MTQSQQNRLNKLKKQQQIDEKLAMEADKRAREEIDKKINSAYYTSPKLALNTIKLHLLKLEKLGFNRQWA